LIAPYFNEDGDITGLTTFDTSGLDDQFSIFNPFDIFNRFGILLTVSTTNIFIGTILTTMTLAFFWVILEMVRGV
jgi:hypothetical protein